MLSRLPRPRTTRTVITGALVACAVALTLLTPTTGTAATTGRGVDARAISATPAATTAATSKVRTVRVPALGKSATVPNPLRGQYRWMGYDAQPDGWLGGDTYYRDQVYWGRLEPADNQFNFSYLDTGLADAEARGGKFHFRVMAYCPSCWMNFRDDWPAVTPPFIPTKTGTDVPDWNHPAFVSQWEELMAELGRRYGNDDRIGIVDVGGYGKYGEYWTDGDEGKISLANSQRLVAAVIKAFPKAHVVLNTMDPNLVVPAVRKYPRLGLRTDCLGAYNMYSLIPTTPALQEVWKRAPVISEWCHQPTATASEGLKQVRQYHVSMVSSGNYWTPYPQMSAAEQAAWRTTANTAGYRYAITSVTTPTVMRRATKSRLGVVWRNDGSAPTYDRWKPRLGLRAADGTIVWQTRWKIPHAALLPGKHRLATTATVPASVGKGAYTLVAQVASTSSRYAPMNLANGGRDEGGWYPLARVRVR